MVIDILACLKYKFGYIYYINYEVCGVHMCVFMCVLCVYTHVYRNRVLQRAASESSGHLLHIISTFVYYSI